MPSLMDVIDAHDGRYFMKAEHYIQVYERYMRKFRNKPVNMLEIGVFQGGSLQIFKKYLGEQAHIFGLDITPKCLEFDEDRVKVYIGDQEDKKFMTELADELPKLQIVLDDGGHTMAQQINTFEVLYPRLAWGGVYICEDVGTSYLSEYGGGLKAQGTFIEYMKDKIDALHALHLPDVEDQETSRNTLGIHFYHSMVVLEKRKMDGVKMIKRKTPNANPIGRANE